jgi:hypothetical protein
MRPFPNSFATMTDAETRELDLGRRELRAIADDGNRLIVAQTANRVQTVAALSRGICSTLPYF